MTSRASLALCAATASAASAGVSIDPITGSRP
jgi:hypothetical protein